MWSLEYSTQFKKDIKRYKHYSDRIVSLKKVLLQLVNTGKVDTTYKPHMLSGEYSNCMECHVQNDFLLVWRDSDNQIIKLLRLGSHSELFK